VQNIGPLTQKMYFETGPETITWASYNPSTVSGRVVIKYVDPKLTRSHGPLCGVDAVAVAGAAARFGTEIPGIAGTHQLAV